tara:strand:- start:9 stop:314 length:306 start_codon:yes stop_codon:yes gene_type:complete
MGLIDEIAKGIRDADKKGKLQRRKRRQNKKQAIAKKAGDTAAVKMFSKRKAQTSKKSKKAQKELNKIGEKMLKRGGKAGIVASAGGFTPAALGAAGLAFVS